MQLRLSFSLCLSLSLSLSLFVRAYQHFGLRFSSSTSTLIPASELNHAQVEFELCFHSVGNFSEMSKFESLQVQGFGSR